MRRSALVALLATLSSPPALAYPQYIARGFAQCSSCHYSPTGGGSVNSMGQGSTAALFPDLIQVSPLERVRAAVAKSDLTGYRDEKPALQAALGVDSRLLFTQGVLQVGGGQQLVFIPM